MSAPPLPMGCLNSSARTAGNSAATFWTTPSVLSVQPLRMTTIWNLPG